MGLERTTMTGFPIKFIKSNERKCINCKYHKKKLFSKNYKCTVILGLNLDDGKYGYCHMYEK